MERRSFLRALVTAAVGAAATPLLPALLTEDPERHLWVPGAKSIIDLGAGRGIEAFGVDFYWDCDVAAGPSYVGNKLLTSQLITKEALRVLSNNLKATGAFNREWYAKFVEGAKVGNIVTVTRPVKLNHQNAVDITWRDIYGKE